MSSDALTRFPEIRRIPVCFILFAVMIAGAGSGCTSMTDPHTTHAEPSARDNPYGPSHVDILSPLPDTLLTTTTVELSFRFLKGRKDGGEHLHLYLDGEKWGVVKSSPVTLKRLRPGPHTVHLEIVTMDHLPLAGGADVRFRVQ